MEGNVFIVKLIIDIDTGGLPFRVELFKIEGDTSLFKIFEKCGIKGIFSTELILTAKNYTQAITNALVYMTSSPQEFFPEFQPNEYNQALYFLGNLITACRGYPNSIIVTEEEK